VTATTLPRTDPVRVVIIDDTPDLRELLSFALERYEFDVVGEAGDGRSGLDLVTELAPDLVLLDLAMPVMDGFEVLPLVRERCPATKIIVLSGFDTAAMSARARELGADGYLHKGISLSATLAYVREVLGYAEPGDATATRRTPVLSEVAPFRSRGHYRAWSAPHAAAPTEAARLRDVLQGAAASLREPTLAVRTVVEQLAVAGPVTTPGEARRQSALLAQLVRETARVDALAADIATVSLHERGLLVSTPGWCRVEELVERVGNEHPIELACHPETRVLVDAEQVSHLLGDLARDAEQRCRSPIVLRADVVDSELRLDVVELVGAAAPEATLEPPASDDGGPASPSGLGRYVVQALAAAHGGTVEDTPALTGGSTLTVRIPQPRG
jgi:DNA-binding NarL/FixJ family response regulator